MQFFKRLSGSRADGNSGIRDGFGDGATCGIASRPTCAGLLRASPRHEEACGDAWDQLHRRIENHEHSDVADRRVATCSCGIVDPPCHLGADNEVLSYRLVSCSSGAMN